MRGHRLHPGGRFHRLRHGRSTRHPDWSRELSARLPDGATLTKLSFAYADVDTDSSVTGGMAGSNRENTVTTLVSVPSSNKSLNPQVATGISVDNTLYDYWFVAAFQGDGTAGLYGALVEYTVVGAPEP